MTERKDLGLMPVQREACGILLKRGKVIKYDGHLSVLKLPRSNGLVAINVYNSGLDV